MKKNEEIAEYIFNHLKLRFDNGETQVDIRAGELWNLLKVNLGLTGVAQVCSAMRKVAEEYQSELLYAPAGGNSTGVEFRYYNIIKLKDVEQFESNIRIKKQSSNNQSIFNRTVKTVETKIKNITANELEATTKLVAADLRYGAEGKIIRECFLQFPKNTDDKIIAMKIALIDMTNSTNLNRHLGRVYLTDLIASIKRCDFDKRVSIGDVSLISELANTGTINEFSFFSKYCLYHNYYIYERDDYVIFDGIMMDHVEEYIFEFEYQGKTYKSTQIKGMIDKMRRSYDYTGYRKLIDTILENNNIQIEYKRRKLDWFVWYNNRATKRTKSKTKNRFEGK